MTDTDRPLTEASEALLEWGWDGLSIAEREARLLEIEEAAVERARPEIEKAAREQTIALMSAEYEYDPGESATNIVAKHDARIAAEAVERALERIAEDNILGAVQGMPAAKQVMYHDAEVDRLRSLTQADKPAAVTERTEAEIHFLSNGGYCACGIFTDYGRKPHPPIEAAVTERKENE